MGLKQALELAAQTFSSTADLCDITAIALSWPPVDPFALAPFAAAKAVEVDAKLNLGDDWGGYTGSVVSGAFGVGLLLTEGATLDPFAAAFAAGSVLADALAATLYALAANAPAGGGAVPVLSIAPTPSSSDSFTFQVSDAAGDQTPVTTFNIAIQSAPPTEAAVDDGRVIVGAPAQTITGSTGPGSSVTIIGAAGDTITGGAGSDLINAMAGSQLVTAGSGTTTVWGGAGDVIAGGTGRLLVDGGLASREQISGGSGASTILGGAGDRITGSTGAGSSVIVGAAGDTIAGGSGSDLINGLAGSQAIFGGSGNTTVWGGPGNTITSGPGQLVVNIDQANFPGAVLVGDNGAKGATTVTGFSQLAGDRLFFQNETSASIDSVVASSQTKNGNTLITLPDGATMTLVGITSIDSTFFS